MEYQPKEKFDKDAMPVEEADAMADAEAVVERSQLLATKDQLIDRMQAIFDRDEEAISNPDRAELDYLEAELKSIDKELDIAEATAGDTLVLKKTDLARPGVPSNARSDMSDPNAPRHTAADIAKNALQGRNPHNRSEY